MIKEVSNRYSTIKIPELPYNERMSNLISNVIKGPQIDVFLYDDKDHPNVMTFLHMKSREDFRNGGTMLTTWIRDIITKDSSVLRSKLTYKGSYAELSNVNYIPIIFEKNLAKQLSDREIIAICLHEVGHHTQYKAYILGALSFFIFPLLNHFRRVNYIKMIMKLYNNNFVVDTDDIPMIILLLLGTIYAKLHEKFLYIDVEYNCDMVAYNLGYGKDLASAFEVMRALNNTSIPVQILFKYVGWFMGLWKTHPDLQDRIDRMLKDPEYVKTSNDPIVASLRSQFSKIVDVINMV